MQLEQFDLISLKFELADRVDNQITIHQKQCARIIMLIVSLKCLIVTK